MQSRQDSISKKVKQKIFEEDVEFEYSDFYDLKNNKLYKRVFVGNLILTSGEIVCTDPLYQVFDLPQSWKIPPGEYPVYLYLGVNGIYAERILYVELIIKDEVPTFWEYSLISEILLKDDFDKKVNGLYPVESGLSCISDSQTFAAYQKEIRQYYDLNENGNFYADVLSAYFDKDESILGKSNSKDWINYKPENAKGNIFIFRSGWGDGLYPRFVGYDKDEREIKFVTDFTRLTSFSNPKKRDDFLKSIFKPKKKKSFFAKIVNKIKKCFLLNQICKADSEYNRVVRK